MIYIINGFNSSSKRIFNEVTKYFDVVFKEFNYDKDIIKQYKILATEINNTIKTEEVIVIGISLGCIIAENLSESTGSKAILINPSLFPIETLSKYQNKTIKHFTTKKDVTYGNFCKVLEKIKSKNHKGFCKVFISKDDEYILIEKTVRELKDFYECKIIEGKHKFLSYELLFNEIEMLYNTFAG